MKANQGFSLLELLTVLVVLGVMAGVAVPSLGRFLGNFSFRNQVGDITANLRYVRLRAVGGGKQIRLSVDDESLIFMLRGGLEEDRVVEIDAESLLTIEPDEIIFSPQGYVTPAVLTFVLGERRRTILMDPLTALPVIQ